MRRAGYRLLTGQTPLVRLRAALTLTLDQDPTLARRGRADTIHVVRAGVRHRRTHPVTPTAAERTDLEALARRAADRLGESTGDLLREWLSR